MQEAAEYTNEVEWLNFSRFWMIILRVLNRSVYNYFCLFELEAKFNLHDSHMYECEGLLRGRF